MTAPENEEKEFNVECVSVLCNTETPERHKAMLTKIHHITRYYLEKSVPRPANCVK